MKVRLCSFLEFDFVAVKYNVLIVEDSKSISNIIHKTFQEAQFNTFIVLSLKQAREHLETKKIDFIILDMNLPDGNGYEIIKQLQKSPIKIFVLTSQTDLQLKEVSYSYGIMDYINKDKDFIFKISQLPSLIQQIEKNKLHTILVLDDSLVVREQIKDILENRNYQVITCSNTKDALEIMSTTSICLLLLDLELQECNGYDFLVKHRNYILETLNISVMFITGNITPNLLRDSNRLGVEEIIKKPYIIEELILKIEKSLLIKEKSKALDCSNQLLSQYKQTVDSSSIVSKTDSKGIITYVNEAFCTISGYTSDELLGKPHNIVRHPDMDSLIFQNLWETIKEYKKPWKGKVKNQKKDGSAYWVQTIINPIFNYNGEILEYIGIRNDITEMETTKEYFKNQFNITKESYKEVINLSKLYENAIEESNIILRFDLNRKITYANKHFYKISGYTKEELIGQSYDFIKRQEDVSDDEITHIWKTVEAGNIWKGQVRNISKTGDNYFSLATFVPIKNAKGEILEYMSIRKDITDVIELHKELEDTQREIVYKMGEIGEKRSKETGNHVKRVAEYSKLLASLYGLSEKDINILFIASPMHDIGKVGIADSLLNKPAKLTNEEYEIMKNHASLGFEILKNSKREVLQAAAIVAHEHHEKYDGTGYPRGLKGDSIHIFGRITAIADVFDALSYDRVYKPAWKIEEIIKLFEEEKGKHFDPDLIDLFMNNIEKFKEIKERYKD